MDRTIISWNLPNVITIPLMAGLGYIAVMLLAQLVQRYQGGGA